MRLGAALAAVGLGLGAAEAGAAVSYPDTVHEPLTRFEAEAVPDCGSPALAEAYRFADMHERSAVADYERARGDFEALVRAASDLVDVADAGRRHGCSALAETIYRRVLETYRGMAFVALRRRAEVGLSRLPRGGSSGDTN